MTDLSELEMRIITYLEEAGLENITDMFNAVSGRSGDPLELMAFQDALERLVRLDLVRVEPSKSNGLQPVTLDESLLAVSDVRTRHYFDPTTKRWKDAMRMNRTEAYTYPYIVYHGRGRAVAIEILEERGWRWWTESK